MKKPDVRLDAEAFLDYFGDLEDPRQQGKIDHLLVDILVIALLAVICGAETWSQIAAYGERKRGLLETLLPLRHGIPSKHTFQRVFARLKPSAFGAAFRGWTTHLFGVTDGKVIAVDGKTLRGSGRANPLGRAMHLVHAWSVQNRMLLGQYATDAKSNEITAIPELLKLLDLKGAVVTIDAGGCHKGIAATIVQDEGNYVITVKGNQPKLLAAVTQRMEEVRSSPELVSYAEESNGGHGRQETRRVWAADARALAVAALWPGLRSCVMVETTRWRKADNTTTREVRYAISSLPHDDAARHGRLIRGHWQVENALHWSLDVAFHEDDSLIHVGHAPENLSLVRKFALTLLTRDKTRRASVAERRKVAGWDDQFLLALLRQGITE